MRAALLLPVLLLALTPGEATAHLASTRFGEVYSGMLHPLTTLQHLVPWLALGLLGGLQSATTSRWALLAFPVSVLMGITLEALLPGLPVVDGFNIATFVALGALVMLKVELRLPMFLLVVGFVGLSHGYANAAPEFTGFAWILYAGGVALVAYLLMALIAAAAHVLVESRAWGTVAVRAAGSWIVAAGAMYAGFQLLLA